MRIEEICCVRKEDIEKALKYDGLTIKGKGGVEKQINSLENWMYANRDKIVMKNRKDEVGDGKKPRSKNTTWYGLRNARAQLLHTKYTAEGLQNPKFKTSEILGYITELISRMSILLSHHKVR